MMSAFVEKEAVSVICSNTINDEAVGTSAKVV